MSLYKAISLGFPLTPGQWEEVWILEAKITFSALGGPVKISLATPDYTSGYSLQVEDFASTHYGFTKIQERESWRAVWSARQVNALQTLYYRGQFLDFTGLDRVSKDEKPLLIPTTFFDEPHRIAADALIESALSYSADIETFTSELLR